MRILFVHSGADLYGASRSLLRLSRRLAQEGNVVKAVLPFDGPLKERLEDCGIDVIIQRDMPLITRQGFGSPVGILFLLPRLLFSVIRLLFTVRGFQPDIIHTNTAVIPSPGIAAKLSGVAHLWHIREFFSEFPGLWMVYQRYVDALSDVIICVSSAVAGQFQPRIQEKKIVVIHNGFMKEEFIMPQKAGAERFRQDFGLGADLLAGNIGRIKFRRKGQEVFAEAAAELKERFPAVKFLCVGSPFPGNECHLHRLKRLIADLGMDGRFICTGDAEDIQAVYAALDIVVLASVLPEPFSATVVEAMAFGKPVIGTRTGGTVEQIEDGVTGLLVEPDDPAALARALERLICDAGLRHKMGEEGRKRFLELFEFKQFFEKILNLYEKTCRRSI